MKNINEIMRDNGYIPISQFQKLENDSRFLKAALFCTSMALIGTVNGMCRALLKTRNNKKGGNINEE